MKLILLLAITFTASLGACQEIVWLGITGKHCVASKVSLFDVERGKLGTAGCRHYMVIKVKPGHYLLGPSQKADRRLSVDLAEGDRVYLTRNERPAALFTYTPSRIERLSPEEAADLIKRLHYQEEK